MITPDSNAIATIVAGVVGGGATVVAAMYGPSISKKINKNKNDTIQVVGYYQSVVDRLNKVISKDERMIDYLKRRNEKILSKQQQLQEIIDNLESRKIRAEHHRNVLQTRLTTKTTADSEPLPDMAHQSTSK